MPLAEAAPHIESRTIALKTIWSCSSQIALIVSISGYLKKYRYLVPYSTLNKLEYLGIAPHNVHFYQAYSHDSDVDPDWKYFI